jgi:aspartyl/asparaginyl beta-hydroxylase (cupin superfamily)
MRTLRVAQTSPLDVHRRFSHVLKMNSQIRASSFARFRRVVGLSRVFHHGCFPRICVLRLCFITPKAVSLATKKERKKEREKKRDMTN